jgi:hypothetical protein
LSNEKNPELKKYADKIREISKDISLEENKPDKYLDAIADAVENNKFQLSATIEGLIHTRKELLNLHKAVVGDILTINSQFDEFNKEYIEFKALAEQNINATTLFHQNMTDLLIAYFGIPKTEKEKAEIALKQASGDSPQKEEIQQPSVPEISDSNEEIENPYIEKSEIVEAIDDKSTETETAVKPEKITTKSNTQIDADIISEEIPEGVEEFKPKGKKND